VQDSRRRPLDLGRIWDDCSLRNYGSNPFHYNNNKNAVSKVSPRCCLCIHIPHYPHPNPDSNPNPKPNPNPKSYPNLKLFNE